MKYLVAAMLLLLTVIVLLLAMGCGPVIVKHPDAPMLIIEARGKVKVAVEKDNKLIEFGWVELEAGWTLVKYDWTDGD